jgi:beta-aspartyl-peptidase (threonine type)
MRWLSRAAFSAIAVAAVAAPAHAADGACTARQRFAVVAHGGEFDSPMTDETGRLPVMRETLAKARVALRDGAHALDVVEMVVRAFEDSGAFNTGKGAIANRAGQVETDASIMDGRDMRAGSVASMTRLKNPVTAARLVMERTPHVLMVGDRGQEAVVKLGAQTVEPSYFINTNHPKPAPEHGTVGAVVLDRCGHIAAATSTGGYDAKIPGRVGDAPIVGAGVYADDRVGGFSATGHGELFIRYSIAKDVADRMAYLREPLAKAMRYDLFHRLDPKADGNDGALIGLDRHGNVVMMWNSVGMWRGFTTDAEEPQVSYTTGVTASRPRN